MALPLSSAAPLHSKRTCQVTDNQARKWNLHEVRILKGSTTENPSLFVRQTFSLVNAGDVFYRVFSQQHPDGKSFIHLRYYNGGCWSEKQVLPFYESALENYDFLTCPPPPLEKKSDFPSCQSPPFMEPIEVKNNTILYMTLFYLAVMKVAQIIFSHTEPSK